MPDEDKILKDDNNLDIEDTKKISPDIKKKLDALKDKLEKLRKKFLDKHKDIMGISLLPPEKKEKASKDINVLVLYDIPEEEKDKLNYKEKFEQSINKIAEEFDKNIKPQCMNLFELRESCFDAKYEILELIALSAPIYDPKDLFMGLKVCELHKSMILKKFEKYVVSYVAVGSLFRGDATSNDIDVAVIVDDTDVKRMSRLELKDKLGAIIRSMGYEASAVVGVKKELHIQVYILTDFWDSIKDASPVIFTFLRDGVPLYDRGIFMPWKLLLEMGRIRPSPEAIDMHMEVGEKLLERADAKLLSVISEEIFYAVLNPSQAALMLYGVNPPTPKETVRLLEQIFVKKEKILEQKYVNILEKIRSYFKDIEHNKIKKISGKELDSLLEEAQYYLKRIKRLFTQIEKRTEHKKALHFYDNTMKILRDVLKLENLSQDNPQSGLKKLVEKNTFPKRYLEDLRNISKIKKEYKTLSKQEVEKIRKETSPFIRGLIEYVQRKRGLEIEKAKIRIKYGDKFGEIFLLVDEAFVVDDIDTEIKEIHKAKIMPDGGLGRMEKSNLKELEDKIATCKIPSKVFIKEKIFEDLRKIYGKDIEVLVNY
ncbi:MAG: hypothetical protein NT139_00760 [Candidatus Woesearchaeota archaeon]|nr:hypothetical protein [Candidatus Woesearchaeota archaeon]